MLHEGLIGVLGDQGLQEFTYDKLDKEARSGQNTRGKVWDNVTGGWLGITDKYWAAALVPDQKQAYQGSVHGSADPGTGQGLSGRTCSAPRRRSQPGASDRDDPAPVRRRQGSARHRRLQGERSASRTSICLIDWGWFYFITKPLFKCWTSSTRSFGNFGVAILIVTVLVKALFFPLANKSLSRPWPR